MQHLGTKTLETTRLLLRKTKESDAQPMFRNWASDPRVTKFMTWYPYESAQQLHDTYHRYLLENQDRKDFYDWKIELKETGEPIGSISVVELCEDNADCNTRARCVRAAKTSRVFVHLPFMLY